MSGISTRTDVTLSGLTCGGQLSTVPSVAIAKAPWPLSVTRAASPSPFKPISLFPPECYIILLSYRRQRPAGASYNKCRLILHNKLTLLPNTVFSGPKILGFQLYNPFLIVPIIIGLYCIVTPHIWYKSILDNNRKQWLIYVI